MHYAFMNRQHKIKAGIKHLRKDRIMRKLIDAVGPFSLRPKRNRFAILVQAIISQQISGAAARNIRGRLDVLLEPEGLNPENMASFAESDLRSVGLSWQKAAYILDLAEKTLDGTVRLDKIGRLSDEGVIEMLTQVKGIGRWTAEMFLISSLGRLDVLPVDDFGIRSAIKKLYGLEELPNKQTCIELALPWRPYASIASWYCWRSLELKPKGEGAQ
jgi:DNA-3-methyladenine glycosylase II